MPQIPGPELSLWEKLDLVPGYLSVLSTLLYSALTGLFRGETGARTYSMHVVHATVRKMCMRLTARQSQYMASPSSKAYEGHMRRKNLAPESVILPYRTTGHWIGEKDANNVLVYYHGGGFVLPANAAHFDFLSDLLATLNANGHDIAIFFLSYDLAPSASYPTQLRQAVESLRYILEDTNRKPSNVMIGGDSAGGNLALAVLLHLSHPHPEIDPIHLSKPLLGVFAIAPWVSFRSDWPSLDQNRYKDIIPKEALAAWSSAYLNGKEGDPWSELSKAPTEWWKGAMAEQVLVLAGGSEILMSAIEEFVERFKTAFPNTTYVVGYGETHVEPLYSASLGGGETQQGRDLKRWMASRL